MPLFQHLISQHLLEQPIVLVLNLQLKVKFSNDRAKSYFSLDETPLVIGAGSERLDLRNLFAAIESSAQTHTENLTTTRINSNNTPTELLWQVARTSSEIQIVGFEISELRRHLGLLDYLQRSERIGAWEWCPENDTLLLSSMAYEILGIPFGAKVQWSDLKHSLLIDESQKLKELAESTIHLQQSGQSGVQIRKELRMFSRERIPAWIEFKARLEETRMGKQVLGTIKDITLKKIADDAVTRIKSGTSGIITELNGFGFELEFHLSEEPYIVFKRTLGLRARSISLTKEETQSLLIAWKTAKEKNGVLQWKGRVSSLSSKEANIALQAVFRAVNEQAECWAGIALPFESPLEGSAEAQIDSNDQGRMAALGELTSGMAHEINNPLAIILGKVDRIRKSLAEEGVTDPGILKHLEVQERASLRIKKIVDELRMVARRPETSSEKLCLSDFLDSFLAPFRELDPTTRITFHPPASPIWALFPRAALEQVAAKKFCPSICVMKNITKEMLYEPGHGDHQITSKCA
jgi:signal transduction histidine kinase